jgi:hypothetical protein
MMATTAVIGALLVVCGLLYMTGTAIFRGRMSDPHASARDPLGLTLEPRRSGLRVLELKANWPGLLLVAIGVLMLLFPLLYLGSGVAG